MKCSECLTNSFLNLSATVYLILGIAIIGVAGSTFFTEYGKILTPMYAGAFLGGGVVLFVLAVIGYLAACRKRDKHTGVQGARCLLWIFTVLTFLMFVVSIIGVIFMFDYEKILAGAAKANVDLDAATESLSDTSTTVIKDVTTNAFDACDANVTAMGVDPTSGYGFFQFRCENTYFKTLSTTINSACLATGAVNASAGSLFADCYAGELLSESSWPVPENAPLPEVPDPPTPSTVLATLNTPKGVFCACSSELLRDYVLKYLKFAKWIILGIAAFFMIVFFSCIHQLCKRGCCGPKEAPQRDHGDIQMRYHQGNGWQAGGSQKAKNRGGGDFLARP